MTVCTLISEDNEYGIANVVISLIQNIVEMIVQLYFARRIWARTYPLPHTALGSLGSLGLIVTSSHSGPHNAGYSLGIDRFNSNEYRL